MHSQVTQKHSQVTQQGRRSYTTIIFYDDSVSMQTKVNGQMITSRYRDEDDEKLPNEKNV